MKLALLIEVPDFGVDDFAPETEAQLASRDELDEQLEVSMGLASDDVVVIFHRHDDVDGHVLEHLGGRIVERSLRSDDV